MQVPKTPTPTRCTTSHNNISTPLERMALPPRSLITLPMNIQFMKVQIKCLMNAQLIDLHSLITFLNSQTFLFRHAF